MPLTPKGMDLMKDAFNDVNIREYKLNMQQNMSSQTYNILVSKYTNGAREFLVALPKVAFKGSHFGSCTCGVPAKEGVPCKHIVVIVKSSVIAGLTLRVSCRISGQPLIGKISTHSMWNVTQTSPWRT